jgi:hypothetical protein
MSSHEQSEHERERPLRVARHRRHLVDALQNPDPLTGTIESSERLAQLLFALIHETHGEQEARRIFARHGTPLTTLQRKELAGLGLLDRLSIMKPQNASELARELATASGTKSESELRQIDRVKKQYRFETTRAKIATLRSRITMLMTKIKKLPEAPARPGSMLKTEDVPEAKAVLEAETARLRQKLLRFHKHLERGTTICD